MMEQAPIETVKPAIRMLSDAQIQAVHDSSLDILARTGIEMISDAEAECECQRTSGRLVQSAKWRAG